MNQKYYLDLLSFYLRDLPEDVRRDIMQDYQEHFRLGLASGQSEEEVAENLGQPDLVAAEILSIEGKARPRSTSEKEDVTESSLRDNQTSDLGKWLLIIVLLILFFPMLIGILGGLFGMVTGLFGAFIALFTGGLSQFFSIFLGLGRFFLNPTIVALHPMTKLFINLFLIALIVLIAQVIIRIIHWFVQSVRDLYLSYKWRKGRGNEK